MGSSPTNVDLYDDYDLVIVGSGLTGLTAAYNILKRHIGLDVLILESRDCIGGRVLLEENSEAFYGNFRQEYITRLIEELEIPVESGPDVDGKHLVFFTKDGPFSPEESSFVSGQVYHFLKSLEAISTNQRWKKYGLDEDSKNLAETSVERLIRSTVYLSRARSICRSLLNASCGIENLENVSVLWLVVMLHGAGGLLQKFSATLGNEKRFFLKGGFSGLAKVLEKRIIEEGGQIKFSETVVEIETNGDRINVCTGRKKFKCDQVVIALPPSASSRIAVRPALPEFLVKSQSLYVPSRNVFFWARYREAFWSEDLSGSAIATADNGSALRIIYDATHPADRRPRVLAGLLSADGDVDPGSSVFGALRKCFRTSRASRCIDSWSSADTESHAYSIRPGPPRYHVNPMSVSLEKIYFAGSEYATSWPGTADGAIEAGETVARSVIFRARPQVLDFRGYVELARRPDRIGEKSDSSINRGIARAHSIFLGLNVCLFFLLLRDAYGDV